MTIALALKVGDAVILGADSASTLLGPTGFVNAYFNAEKVFNLVKGLPIGGVAYGLGGLDKRSLSYVMKDLRQQFTNNGGPRYLDPTSYQIADVARHVKEFVYDSLYCREYPQTVPDPATGKPKKTYQALGFMIAGYSAAETQAEVWAIEIRDDGTCVGPTLVCPRDTTGWIQGGGQPEAIQRLLGGYSPRILQGLVKSGLDETTARSFLSSQPMEVLVQPAMPIQDAIDLVDYLIQVTAGFVRFTPGPPTVSEPIDIAAITQHEGFRWVRRKHYFRSELNPPLG
jgi:hypothetical protein